MNKKLALRTGIGLAVIVGLIIGYAKFSKYSLDTEIDKSYNTAGMIAAVQNNDMGSRAVVFNPSGEKIESSGYTEGKSDSDVSWSKDGSLIYFSSNRESDAYNIYRWTPTTNKVERRSLGGRSQSSPVFDLSDYPDEEKTGLVVSGGQVYRYIPRMKAMEQLLPPVAVGGVIGEEGGRQSMMAVYDRIGENFRQAAWGPDHETIFTVMGREDGSEVFVVNWLKADDQGVIRPPQPLFAGDHIQMEVGADGRALVAVQNFQFPDLEKIDPQFLKDGKVVLPFKHCVCDVVIAPDGAALFMPIMRFASDKELVWDIALSPDGSEFVATGGEMNGQDFVPRNLVLIERRVKMAADEPPASVAIILDGKFGRPRWSPDGQRLVLLRDEEDGRRALITMRKDGGDLQVLSKPGEDYVMAAFSPQIPAE